MKIKGVELTDKLKWSKVTYVPKHDSSFREEGTISSWNDKFVFVRYERNTAATHPDDLVWG